MKEVIITVCWKCKSRNKTLHGVKDEAGRKTKDYVCVDCLRDGYGKPSIGNQSFVKENRLEIKEIRELEKKKKEENDKSK